MPVLHRDIETRSTVDLKKSGPYPYASEPTTEVLCVAYAVDDEPVDLWTPGRLVPPIFFEAARDPSWLVVAHNDMFESCIERFMLHPRHGWPLVPIERHRCTMAMCLALALPGSLDLAADALGLSQKKDPAGHKLMLQMTKPRKARKNELPGLVYWVDGPERRGRLGEYCRQDVEVERQLFEFLEPLSDTEHQLWCLDRLINDRGFPVDRELALGAHKIAKTAQIDLNAELAALTAGQVTSVNQTAKLQAWLAAQGCVLKSLGKEKVADRLLTNSITPEVRRALELRRDGAPASVKKFKALLDVADADNRARGLFRYHGSGPGRWTASRFQPQNLRRPDLNETQIEQAITLVGSGDYAAVRTAFAQPMAVIGDLGRSLIKASSGKRFIGADFSAIEGRVLAWLAGEDWKIESYRRFDLTGDPRDEPYCITACKIFRKPPGTFNKASLERKVGKTCELAFGFMGALGAWRKFEPNGHTDEEVERFKREWRTAHPKIVEFWRAIDQATRKAVMQPYREIECGRISILCEFPYLFITLPSGRRLSYPFPSTIARKHNGNRQIVISFKDSAAGQFKDCRHGQGAWPGLWTENVVQATARDLLAEALIRLERAGYPTVLHVHDEIVCEVAEDFGSPEEFVELMTTVPNWADGLPIAANAWTGPRFAK
jgi:DNA polymerase bacteriophage-type